MQLSAEVKKNHFKYTKEEIKVLGRKYRHNAILHFL